MKIGLYGDSTQVGLSIYAGVGYQADWPPSKLLQVMLDYKYGHGVHTVSNYGVRGSTLWQAMSTGLYSGQNILNHVTAQGDDIVFMNFGINDCYVAGYTPAAHKANYGAVKASVESMGKIFVYESPNPIDNTHDPLLQALDAAVKTIPGIRNMDTYTQVKTYYPQWTGHLSDTIHPNYIMYFYEGDLLFKAVDSLL